jgi:hypothetical protein
MGTTSTPDWNLGGDVCCALSALASAMNPSTATEPVTRMSNAAIVSVRRASHRSSFDLFLIAQNDILYRSRF